MLTLLDLRGRSRAERLDLPRPELSGEGPVDEVRAILAEVRERGDAALVELTERFDQVHLDRIAVPSEELSRALASIPVPLRDALEEARDAIAAFHAHRRPPAQLYERDGIRVHDLEIPVDRAGVYAPGGRAKYPSSVLMTAVPAKVAGVGAVACCVPPGPDGRLADEILAAAALAGVDELYQVGGAQAIAAMAYGTQSIPKVDVIVGPGNKWVSLAQREVRGHVGVPSAFAGPSEVVVVADDSVPPEWAAIDVIVQAEHGPDGLAWLVTWSEQTAKAVSAAVAAMVAASPRRAETEATLAGGGYAVLVDDAEQAMEVANAIAAEHLELLVEDPDILLGKVRHAGAVFLGPLAPAAVGDYLAGPSHVLPTAMTARFASVLGVEDFLRRVHAISVDQRGIARVARHVATIATAEGLPAHAEAALQRIGQATWSRR